MLRLRRAWGSSATSRSRGCMRWKRRAPGSMRARTVRSSFCPRRQMSQSRQGHAQQPGRRSCGKGSYHFYGFWAAATCSAGKGKGEGGRVLLHHRIIVRLLVGRPQPLTRLVAHFLPFKKKERTSVNSPNVCKLGSRRRAAAETGEGACEGRHLRRRALLHPPPPDPDRGWLRHSPCGS